MNIFNKLLIIILLPAAIYLEQTQENDEEEKTFLDTQAAVQNEKLMDLREELQKKYDQARLLYEKKAHDEEYKQLLVEIKVLKEKILSKEQKWKKQSQQDGMQNQEDYAYWDQGETTLSSLLMEYGSTDYLYVIPYELGSMKIHLYSSIPVPHESWDEMLTMILTHNGIGVKQLNPYLRQLYIMKHDPSYVEGITHSLEDLENIQDFQYVFHVLSLPEEKVRTAQSFFERFSDPKQTTVQNMASKIILIGTKENILRLLKLYQAVWDDKSGKSIKTLSLNKLTSAEGEKILRSFFQENYMRGRPPIYSSLSDELQIFSLSQTNQLVLIGSSYLLEKSEKILKELEVQVDQPGEKVIYWYTCKHTNPEDIAAILNQVYQSLTQTKEAGSFSKIKETKSENKPSVSTNTYISPVLTVSPPSAQPGTIPKKEQQGDFGSFIVDGKSGSILMVVRKEDLAKIKALLKKLDVPKQMVQIEVLLVEKKLNDRKQMGINLLKIGTERNTKKTEMSFDTTPSSAKKGVLDFIINRSKGKLPSFDFAMSFLMGQDDLRINANPSVLAVNQTPATISIVEELSINNGAVTMDSGSSSKVEKSFTRAQYGITIVLTPTIHPPDEEDKDKKGYVTLQTDITFDTTQTSEDDRPPVTRRHIINEVRIADGETIILGGLRRLSDEDVREKIPFLGDLPGIGKLFGTTKLSESSTEMFIFITPRIIKNLILDLQKIRQKELERRPGDIPEFVSQVDEAKKLEKQKYFEKSMQVLFSND